MKTLLLLLGCACLTGCMTCVTPEGKCYRPVYSDHSIVNNTGYLLDVVQDGVPVSRNLAPGQILSVPPRLFDGRSVVIVTGHTVNGEYIGAATWIFYWGTPDAWVITGVQGYAP